MGDQKPTALRRYIYQGDPLLAPPPPELAAILERYRGQPDARLDHRRRREEDGSTTERRRWDYASTAAIMDEVARVAPIYGGIRHARLAGQSLVWPCTSAEHAGTPTRHTQTFTHGHGRFYAMVAQEQAEEPDAAFPLILTTGRLLYHYHTGTMTRRSVGLTWRESRGYAEIHEQDAVAAGIRDGGPVLITSRRGQIRTQARVGQRVPPGTVFLSFHWKAAPANLITQDFALDPLAKIPECKVCAVRLERPRSGAHGKPFPLAGEA